MAIHLAGRTMHRSWGIHGASAIHRPPPSKPLSHTIASPQGLRVAIIEGHDIGGTCVNRGCVPSKALLAAAGQVRKLKDAHHMKALGIQIEGLTYDRATIAGHAQNLAQTIQGNLKRSLVALGVVRRKGQGGSRCCWLGQGVWGVAYCVACGPPPKRLATRLPPASPQPSILTPPHPSQITKDILVGQGKFAGPHTIKYSLPGRVDVGGSVTGRDIIIATGSVPFVPPGIAIDGKTVFTSDHALRLDWVPDWLAIIGSGYIGLEFSDVYTALGSEVSFIEALPSIMPGFDKEIARTAQRALISARAIDFRTGVIASRVTPGVPGVKPVSIELMDFKTKEVVDELEVDACLVATGRSPYTNGLNLGAVGAATDRRGFVPVNDKMQVRVRGWWGGVAGEGGGRQGPRVGEGEEKTACMLGRRCSGACLPLQRPALVMLALGRLPHHESWLQLPSPRE